MVIRFRKKQEVVLYTREIQGIASEKTVTPEKRYGERGYLRGGCTC